MTSPLPAVRLVARADVPAAARAMARGYQDYPLFQWLQPDPERRARFLAWAAQRTVAFGVRYGRVYADEPLTGAAVWFPPGSAKQSLLRLVLTGLAWAPWKLGPRHARKLVRFVAVVDNAHRRYERGPHWYLDNIAVIPERQRQGVGAGLIREGLRQADAARLPVILETQKDENVPYYQRYGFRVVDVAPLPWDGPRNYTLIRPAASVASTPV